MITVIGSLNMDLLVLTDRVPNTGETLAGKEMRFVPGGKGANQAIAASRTGAKTIMLGCVGDDSFGPVLIQSLKEAHVDSSLIQTARDASTGTAVVLLDASNDNRIIILPGANGLVTPTFVLENWDVISKSTMIILQHEVPLETVRTVIMKANEAGIRVLLNPAPMYPIAADVLAKVDILILNENEAGQLSGMKITDVETALDVAETLNAVGVKMVIITLGKGGAVLVDGKNRLFYPAYSVKTVDTTAAGDTFVGSFAASLLEGKQPEEALKYATAAAGLAVSRLGAQPSIPTKQEVERFILTGVSV